LELKQVIAVRTDLQMGKGKLAAQVAHAALSAAEATERSHSEWYTGWKSQGQAKVVVKVKSEEEILDLMQNAKSLRIPAALIQDKGLTQVDPGTITCLGLGPAPSDLVDRVTGRLKLL
jgi:peptidyl-tRNA hydrolase, PTH2 family